MSGDADSSTTYSNMVESAVKHRKRYVYHPKGRLKLTCLINVPGNSSDGFKVIGDFGTNYAKERPTKDLRQEPETNKMVGRKQENNTAIQHAVYEIMLQEYEKLSVKDETHENIDNEVDEDELYGILKLFLIKIMT